MAGNREYDESRMQELILYVAEKLKDDPCFDMDKLAYVLWRCDFEAYRDLGQSITGAEYVKAPGSLS